MWNEAHVPRLDSTLAEMRRALDGLRAAGAPDDAIIGVSAAMFTARWLAGRVPISEPEALPTERKRRR